MATIGKQDHREKGRSSSQRMQVQKQMQARDQMQSQQQFASQTIPDADGGEESAACVVCCETFGPRHLRTVTSCGHDDVCSLCVLKMRSLGKDKACPMCKAANEYVVCISAGTHGARWDQFQEWGDSVGPDHVLDPRSHMHFPKSYFREHVESLWTSRCQQPGCGQVRRDAKSLAQHLKAEHNMMLCQLCLDHRHVFPAEQRQYTQAEYEQHLRRGDGDGGQGHPNCDFCRRRFYDKTALFMHLSQDHHTCHLCEREGVQFKYYNEYVSSAVTCGQGKVVRSCTNPLSSFTILTCHLYCYSFI